MATSSGRRNHKQRGLSGVGLAVAIATAGCAAGGTPTPETTFGDPTLPAATATMTATTTASSMDDEGTNGTTSDPAGSAGAETATADGATTAGAAGDGPQPENGMYSDCLSTAECVGVNTCVTIFDMAGAPFDGFCTLDNCQDPVVDCDPSPGGDVVASCVPITLNGMAATACALDCSGGKTCPTGMICYEDEGVPVCA